MNMSLLRDRYGRPAVIVAAAWMVVLTGIVLFDQGHWRHLPSLTPTMPTSDAVWTLEARVTALERQQSAQQRQPAPIAAERFAASTHALEERLSGLELAATTFLPKPDFDALATRVSTLESVHAHLVEGPTPPPRRKADLTPSSTPSAPPFRVLGLEMRGGESFLAVAPARALSLAEMSVLRVGDVQEGWQLEALDTKTASFRFQDQLHRLELP